MDAVVVVYVYQTEIAETLLAGRAPAGMAAMDAPQYLLVTNPETNSVTVLDLENNGKLVASVQVGQEPRAIVVTPAREGQDQYALVLNEKSGDLAVIRIYSLLNQDPKRRHHADAAVHAGAGRGGAGERGGDDVSSVERRPGPAGQRIAGLP